MSQIKSEALPRGQLSTLPLVFMIIAASAPLTVFAGGTPTNYAVSELLGVPLAYLALGLILAFFAVGYGRMASQIHNAGAFYVYIARGLGLRQGIGGAVVALVSYNLMQIGLYGLFGFSAAHALAATLDINIPWWLCGGVAWLLVAILGIRNIDLSAKVLGIVVLIEFLVVSVASIYALVQAPEGITSDGWQPQNFFAPGIGILLSFSMAAFMGFESGAIYSEETKQPAHTVPRATYIAIAAIAVFYAVSAWALQISTGPSSIINQSQEFGPDLVFVWLAEVSPAAANTAHILFVVSLLAALIAFHNASARYFFSLGRSTVLPEILAKTGKTGAPFAGSLVQSALSVAVVGVFAIVGQDSELGELFPVMTLFTWFTNTAALGLTFMIAITSVAVCVWANREHKEYNFFVRTLAPVLAAIGMALVTTLILVNFDIMMDSDNAVTVWIMPIIILAAGAAGLIRGQRLIKQKSTASHIFSGEPTTSETLKER